MAMETGCMGIEDQVFALNSALCRAARKDSAARVQPI